MEIAVAEQGAFCVPPTLSIDEARGHASHYRTSAFGGLTQLFSRPKPDDVSVVSTGLRYVPYWHAATHLKIVYDRRESYRFPISTPDNVVSIRIGESVFAIDGERKERGIGVTALAQCVRELRKDLWIEATSGEAATPRSTGTAVPIELGSFAPENAEIVDPVVRASAVIRQILGDDVKPPEADAYHEERADVEQLDLFFMPFYAYDLVWAAKSKTVAITVDGCSGEIVQTKNAIHPAIAKLLNKDTLFDIGSETLNLVVPGGAIPLKIVQALRRKQREDSSRA